MNDGISLEMLAFNLKLLGRKSRKKVLISAGKLEDKKRMLPAIKQFLTLEVDVFSTPGTHKFLSDRGIETTEIHKITDRRAPNILTFLKENRFDLVINVLYYSYALSATSRLTFDYQFIANPGYATERGPVNVFAGRFHTAF